ncbi:hypothetical protein KSF73_14305 [Burkholderiaceae bacterium DAT-1]|nr:hypothetical protein [Burkholderiaceae bacterium DAT-1]
MSTVATVGGNNSYNQWQSFQQQAQGQQVGSSQAVSAQLSGMSGFSQSFLQTLEQLGISLPGQPFQSIGNENAKKSAAASAGQQAGQQSTSQVVHAFMQNLFAAMQASASQGAQTESRSGGQQGRGNMATAIANLAGGLSQHTSGGKTVDTSAAAYESLGQSWRQLLAASESSGKNSASNQPSLQSFLQTLSSNVASRGGHVVSTTA